MMRRLNHVERERLVTASVIAGLVLGSALFWIALFPLGGRLLVAIVALVGLSLAAFVGWWMHTWDERNAKLPRARARGRGRR